MILLFIVGVLAAELLLARAVTHERATLILGVISAALGTLCVILYLNFVRSSYRGWEGLGVMLVLYIVYIMAAVNALAGCINGVIALHGQHQNRNRVKVGLLLNGIVLILILFNSMRRLWF